MTIFVELLHFACTVFSPGSILSPTNPCLHFIQTHKWKNQQWAENHILTVAGWDWSWEISRLKTSQLFRSVPDKSHVTNKSDHVINVVDNLVFVERAVVEVRSIALKGCKINKKRLISSSTLRRSRRHRSVNRAPAGNWNTASSILQSPISSVFSLDRHLTLISNLYHAVYQSWWPSATEG